MRIALPAPLQFDRRSPTMDMIIGTCVGIALAACCGFRVFVPLLVMSIAAQNGYVNLGDSFEWMGSPLATFVFGAATVAEVVGYYIPWFDNLLDTIATPAAAIAGTLVAAAMMSDIDPTLKWAMAIIAGGGLATGVQTLTVGTRAVSTATTGGVGNPVVATVEGVSSFVVSILVVTVQIVGVIIVVSLVAWLIARSIRRRKLRAAPADPASA
jgi:ABC-type glycerol-3-phosphate transport system permease component